MAESLGEAVVEVGADTSRLENDVKKGVEGPLKKAAGTITAIAGGFIAANVVGQAASAVKQFVGDSISAASNLEESINAVVVSYGEAADEVLALGENSAEQFGLSERAVNEAATALAGFATKIDAADPADAFENILGRATDFASVMNLDVEDALAKFQSGLAGESEPLRKFGIDVSAAKVEAFALANGIIETGEVMTEAQKIQARYGTIMEQTAKVQGDFANTSDGLANTQRRLSAEWEDMQARIGQALLPAVSKLLQTGEKLIPVFEDIATAVAETASEIANTIQPLLDAVAFLGEYKVQLGETEEQSYGLIDAVKAGVGLFTGDYSTSLGAATDLAGNLTDSTVAAAEATEFLGEATFDIASGPMPEYNAQVLTFTESTEFAREQAVRWGQELVDLADKQAATAGKIAEATKAVYDQIDAERAAIDPAFRLVQAQQDLGDAQQAVNDLIAAGAEGTPDFVAASLDLADATLAVNNANLGWIKSGAGAEEQLRLTLEQAGFTKQQIDDLVEAIGIYNSTDINPKDFILNLIAGNLTGANAMLGPGEFMQLHSGGVFRSPTPGGEGLALLRDREVVLTPQQARGGAIGDVSVTVNITGAVSTFDAERAGRAAADAAIRRLADARLVS